MNPHVYRSEVAARTAMLRVIPGVLLLLASTGLAATACSMTRKDGGA
jgi:hypothetical protein